MSSKKKHRAANEYLQYLKGDLSKQERYSFEKDLEADPFGKEAMEGMELLSTDQVEEDILTLHGSLRKRLGRRRRIAWYSAAASIASLLIIGTVFLQIYDFNPEKTEKSLNEETFGVSPPTEQPESIPADEVPGIEGESVDETTGQAEERIEATREVSAELERMVPAPEAPKERAPVEEGRIEETLPREAESDAIMYVEAEAVSIEDEALVVDEAVVREDKAVTVKDEVVHKEIMAVPETRKRTERRSKQLNEPAVTQPVVMQKTASSEGDYSRLVSGHISGVVISAEDMEPLPGASVAFKGNITGVVTNMDGMFTLPLHDDSNNTLVASFVGMETQEYQLNNYNNIQLVMQPDALTLNEVVMVGKGIQSADAPAGASSNVKMEDDQKGSARSAQPKGGFDVFKKYMEENIQFPDVETSADRVVVVLKFTVTSEGDLSDFTALRSPGESFTREAIRLINEGPSWNPGYDDKGNIEEILRLRIVFKR